MVTINGIWHDPKGLEEFVRLRNKYQSNSLEFQHSIGSVAQATRNGIRVDVDDDLRSALVYTTKFPGRQKKDYLGSAEINPGDIVVVASSGKFTDEHTRKFAGRRVQPGRRNVIVKNVALDSSLTEMGFEEYTSNEQWDRLSKYDDNTFPQQVVDSAELVALKGNKFARLREEISRFHRENDVITRKGYNPESFDRMLSLWASQMAERNGLDQIELVKAYDMFRKPNDYWDPFKPIEVTYETIDRKTGNMVGINVMSETSHLCLAHHVSLNDFSVRGSCRAMMYEAIKLAHELDYPYINLQGSEDEAQHRSKRKFRAPIEIPKKHLIYRG